MRPYLDHQPQVGQGCFVAETAQVIGRVVLEKDVNVWFGAVIRGDVNDITVGERTNIQDNAVVHVADGYRCDIGSDVTVGHGAIVHACTIGNRVLVGMGSIVLDGAVIGDNVMIGAGALVPPGKVIPSNVLVVGSPCKIIRALTDQELENLYQSAAKYVALSNAYK